MEDKESAEGGEDRLIQRGRLNEWEVLMVRKRWNRDKISGFSFERGEVQLACLYAPRSASSIPVFPM